VWMSMVGEGLVTGIFSLDAFSGEVA